MSQVPLPKDTLLSKCISVFLWVVGLMWMIPMMTLMMLFAFTVGPDKTDWFSRIYTKGQVFLTGCKYRVQVHPDIKEDGVYLFAQNHTNLLDHVVLYHATPHFKQGVELASHFKIPVYGWFMKARGTIGVVPRRRKQTDAIMAHIRKEISKGHSILAFPEAHRTLDGRVRPFKRGMFLIARDVGVPIIPVAVTGWYQTARKGSWILRPGYTVTVHCLKPIATKGLSDAAIQHVAVQAQEAVSNVIDTYWSTQSS